MSQRAVVFDLGGVLVDWQPHLAWLDHFGSEAATRAFMERIDFMARNLRCDAGEAFADVAAELPDPEDARLLAEYVARYQKTVQGRVAGSWDILHALRANGTPLHAITNWSAETWVEGVQVQPELLEVFQTIIVSGQEGIIKPDPAIFSLFCTRAGLAAQDCIFIDDGLHNVEAARACGFDGIHFTGADDLHRALSARGLL